MNRNVTIFRLVLTLVLSIISNCSCNKVSGTHTFICFNNTSKYYLYVWTVKEYYGDCDTLEYRNYSAFGQERYRVAPETCNTKAIHLTSRHFRKNTYEDILSHYDYLSVYIWNKDDVFEKNGVYRGPIIARYDLTMDNLILLDWEIFFPPNESMRSIHMYPPYEEIIAEYSNQPIMPCSESAVQVSLNVSE